MKKLLLTLMAAFCLIMCMGAISADAMVSMGSCGTSAVYTLDTEEGVLVIEGTGAMRDFSYNTVPWYSYRDYIEAVEIGDGITTVGKSAFYNCTKLVSVELSDSITRIGSDAFECCSSLTSINIPDNVTAIDSYAFLYCEDLEDVKLGEGVKSIGYMAFGDCGSLNAITIPESVTKIERFAFDGCINLTYAFCEGSKEALSIGSDNTYLTDILMYGKGTCGKTLSWEFDAETGVMVIKGTGAMNSYSYNTSPWYNNRNYIKKIIIENGVTSIGKYAFHNCSNLALALYKGSEEELSVSLYNTSLTDVLVYCKGTCGEAVVWSIDIETGALKVSGSGKMKNYSIYERAPWYAICGYITDVEIDNGVTSIGAYSFDDCGYLKTVTIAESVEEIDEYAFSECDKLKYAYYGGDEADWKKIYISRSGNSDLTYYSTIYYTYEPTIPDTEGKTPCIGKTTFTFTPVGVNKGDIIAVLAVKDGVSTSYAKTYSGTGTVTFEIEDGFNSIKVLVWDSYESIEPLMEHATIE